MARTKVKPATLPVKTSPVPHFVEAWRRERRLTQDQLAERASTTHGSISRLETGEMSLSQKMIFRLAPALRIEPGDLFRSPDDRDGIWGLAQRIRKLTEQQRQVAGRLIDALAAGEDHRQ